MKLTLPWRHFEPLLRNVQKPIIKLHFFSEKCNFLVAPRRPRDHAADKPFSTPQIHQKSEKANKNAHQISTWFQVAFWSLWVSIWAPFWSHKCSQNRCPKASWWKADFCNPSHAKSPFWPLKRGPKMLQKRMSKDDGCKFQFWPPKWSKTRPRWAPQTTPIGPKMSKNSSLKHS